MYMKNTIVLNVYTKTVNIHVSDQVYNLMNSGKTLILIIITMQT